MGYAQLEKSSGVAILWLDCPDEKVNTLSPDMMEEFKNFLDEIEKDPEVKSAVLISKKADNFIVGANVEVLKEVKEADIAQKMSQEGSVLLNRLENFPKPFVAAIHGAALGGGLEVAMACHYRIATDHPKTVLGLPEVKLGLLPGAGGTQRLPRLIGISQALSAMLTGKNIYPKKAKKMGLVDKVIHRHGLLAAAKMAALQLVDKPVSRKSKKAFMEKLLESNPFTRSVIYKKSAQMVQKQTWGNYPAPLKIIDVVKEGVEKGFKQGLELEAKSFGALVVSPESRELVDIFLNMTKRKKNPAKEDVRPTNSVGILGAGFMGAGIANVTAVKEIPVFLKDISLEAASAGEKMVWDDMTKKVKKKALTPFARDVVMSRIHKAVDYKALKNTDIVIEAVFEDLDLKRKVLALTEEVVREDCIFASNTSSLPIADIAAQSKHPERVIGMHYFSPVPLMPLLEIIVTDKTAPWVTATTYDLGVRQGKTVIVVKDGPGFYTTRVLAPFMNEAMCLLEEGADIKQLDRAIKQFGFPVGPIALCDEVGIDVGAHVSKIMSPLTASRGVEASKAIEKIFEAGYKGRKNKKGFYKYDGKKKTVNEDIYEFFGGKQRKDFDAELIQNRMALIMINEAAYCLQEGILDNPEDGDTGAVFGIGFPPFRGGPFKYIDNLGIDKIIAQMQDLEQKYGKKFTPAPILKECEKNNNKFYNGK